MAQLSFDILTDRSWGHHRKDEGVQHVRTTLACTPHRTTEALNAVGGTTKRITTGSAQIASRTTLRLSLVMYARLAH
eukprot:6458752-Pyramimonas_sp.AAC.1